MSLDVTLYSAEDQAPCVCPKCGNVHQAAGRTVVYERNITHNLNTMAGKADIYEYLWRPDEIGIKVARDLIAPLHRGLDNLRMRPEYFKQFNPPNGWGDYDGLVNFVEEYLAACETYPLAPQDGPGDRRPASFQWICQKCRACGPEAKSLAWATRLANRRIHEQNIDVSSGEMV